ncbi:MAG: acyltransferase [Chloroflexi bacterium]|nr:acyltransferase [Chloroflexota bacterium]
MPKNEHVPQTKRRLIRLLKTDPFEIWRLFRVAITTAKYRYVKRCAGKGTIIGPGTEIVNAANVSIGKGCLLQDSVYIRAGVQGQVTIGDRAALNSFCKLFGHGGIEIGEDAQLGPGSLVTTTQHDYQKGLQTSFKRVVIGKQAWIGANATILPGVEIGERSVIGAGSVVTKSIPAQSIAVGAPARVIKQIDDAND